MVGSGVGLSVLASEQAFTTVKRDIINLVHVAKLMLAWLGRGTSFPEMKVDETFTPTEL